MNLILNLLMMGSASVGVPENYLIPPPSLAQDEAAAEDGEPAWTGAVNVGGVVTSGNTQIKNASASADGVLKREKDRWSLGAFWNYSEEDGAVTQRRLGANAQYDYFVNEKLYYLGQASAEYDAKSNLDLRTTVGAGVGYQWRDDDEWRLSTEAGLAWYREDYDGVDDDYIAARLAYNADYLANEKWSLHQTGSIFPSLEDSDDVYTKLDTRAKLKLTEKMFAQLQWVWDWDNTPPSGNDRSDHRYVVSLGWTF